MANLQFQAITSTMTLEMDPNTVCKMKRLKRPLREKGYVNVPGRRLSVIQLGKIEEGSCIGGHDREIRVRSGADSQIVENFC